jgi:predicted TIM-barrel fold metal-dependent hydrolase
MFGPERLLFGTDWPFTAGLMHPKEYLRAVCKLAAGSDTDPNFMSAEIKGLLGKNAQKLLAGD